ncbi:MAG: hypothetical protein LBS49_01855 [Candidatus Accumulibacter sp.]|jgi:hypothetical protein|nr:hypothetical protein [Accumulibacter sp.]
MKQNVFADICDFINTEGGPETIIAGFAFLFFLWAWIHFETFIGALILSVIGGGLVGGGAYLVICLVSSIFARW